MRKKGARWVGDWDEVGVEVVRCQGALKFGDQDKEMLEVQSTVV